MALPAAPAPDARSGLAPGRSASLPEPPSNATRAALWRHAGLRRSPEGLRELANDPFPLARLIASFALGREESRGSHVRVEFPERDPGLDGRHQVCGVDGEPSWQSWA